MNATMRAARSRLSRSHGPMTRRRMPHACSTVLRGEWPEPMQWAAIQRGGMDVASAWRSGVFGRAMSMPRTRPAAIPVRSDRRPDTYCAS